MSEALDLDSWAANLRLTPNAPVPLYFQLKEQLRALATSLGPDALMPSEAELMSHAGVSRATARKAVNDLVQEGILRAQRGRGTFTAPRRFETTLEGPIGFSETMRRLGRTPSAKVLSVERLPATTEMSARLAIPLRADVLVVERLRLIDGEPAMVERTHLASALVPGLQQRDLTGSLYTLLADEYQLVAARGTETIIAVNADKSLAALLEVEVGSALLATVRATETEARMPLEYTVRHARGDMCSFSVSLREGSALGDRRKNHHLLREVS